MLQLFVQDAALIDLAARQATFDLLEGVQPDTVLIEPEYTALMPWVQACRAAQMPFGGFFDDLLLPATQIKAALQLLNASFSDDDKQGAAGKMRWLLEFATEQKAGVVAKREPSIGMPCVEWREPNEVPTNESDWERNKTRPRVGEVRWARPRGSHRTPVGGHLWLHYEPRVAVYPYGGLFPADVAKWCLVECEILATHEPISMRQEHEKFLDAHPDLRRATIELEAKGAVFAQYPEDEYKGWIQVRCKRVVPLVEVPQHFPTTHHAPPPVTFRATGDYYHTTDSPHLIYHEGSDCCGEASEWWVVTKTTPRRLVLYCFEIGIDPFEIHNAILPE